MAADPSPRVSNAKLPRGGGAKSRPQPRPNDSDTKLTSQLPAGMMPMRSCRSPHWPRKLSNVACTVSTDGTTANCASTGSPLGSFSCTRLAASS